MHKVGFAAKVISMLYTLIKREVKLKAKILARHLLAIMVFGLCASPVMAKGSRIEPIGDYTSFGGKLYKTTFTNSTVYNGLGVNVSYQLIPNIYVGVDAESAQNPANNTTDTISENGLFLGLVMGVGTSVDLGLVLSPINRTQKICSGNLCISSSVTDNGLFGKWWLGSTKNFNVGLHLNKYTYVNSNTTYNSAALSFAYFVGKKHELSFKGSRMRDSNDNEVSTTSSFGYNYHFK